MNIIEISCPSKTFILGEYGVLDKGSALLFNTTPRFKGRFKKVSKETTIDFHRKSPASQWVKKNPSDFSHVLLEWEDPFKGQGGFGFSSAKFNILYAYSCFLKGTSIEKIKPKEIWRIYRNMEFEGWIPSGADIVSQWVGGACVFEQDPLIVESLTAYFPDLGCFILRTGGRLATYEYLKNLDLPDVSDLKKVAKRGIDSMLAKKEEDFIDCIQEYSRLLLEKNFVAEKTKTILDRLSAIPEVKACKGCGAMGAETAVVFFDADSRETIREQISDLEIIADDTSLTYGLEFHKVTQGSDLGVEV